MRRITTVLSASFMFCAAATAVAQSLNDLQEPSLMPFAFVNFEDVYSRSDFGIQIENRVYSARQELAEQNKYFDCHLETLEKALQTSKNSMNSSEFEAARSNFNVIAVNRRQVQDKKESNIAQWRILKIADFESAIQQVSDGIIGRNKRLYAIFNSEGTLWYDPRVDLSDQFVLQLNEYFQIETNDVHDGPDSLLLSMDDQAYNSRQQHYCNEETSN